MSVISPRRLLITQRSSIGQSLRFQKKNHFCGNPGWIQGEMLI